MVQPPPDLSGACRFAVEVRSANGNGLAGALVAVKDGRVVSCSANLKGQANAWASGSVPAWLRAVIEQDPAELEMGGDGALAGALLDGLHKVLSEPHDRH
jgi:hypothetical protein